MMYRNTRRLPTFGVGYLHAINAVWKATAPGFALLGALLGLLIYPSLASAAPAADKVALINPSPPAPTGLQYNLATAYGADTFHTQNIQQFADEVAAATNGKLRFMVHPNASRLKATEIFPAVRERRIEAGEVILSLLESESPIFGIDAIPFLVTGYEDARQLWRASRDATAAAFARNGMRLLYAVPWPPQNLYSNSPIERQRDLEGRTTRTYNPTTTRIGELVAAKPVTIQVPQLAQAISDGKVDFMFTSSWTGVETKAWTRLKYYYTVNAWIPKNAVFMNAAAFDALDPATQKTLIELAARAEERGWAMSQENLKSFDQQLASNGVRVISPGLLLSVELRWIGEKCVTEWLRKSRDPGLKILLDYETSRFGAQAQR